MHGSSLAVVGRNLVDETYRGRFTACCLVLEDVAHGPQLCLGAIAASLPPHGGGPDVVGWSWDQLPHNEHGHSRYGCYRVVGRYQGHGTPFLTEPAAVFTPPDATPAAEAEDRWLTRCPEPEGGWRPLNPSRATWEALDQAATLAQSLDGCGLLWIDQNLSAGQTSTIDNDPTRIIVNVTTTGDVADTHRRLSAVWGGSLCVTPGLCADADLEPVQAAVSRTPGMLLSSRDALLGRVELTVARGTQQLQAYFDTLYGADVVELIGALEPID
jgi:hypothetical protein